MRTIPSCVLALLSAAASVPAQQDETVLRCYDLGVLAGGHGESRPRPQLLPVDLPLALATNGDVGFGHAVDEWFATVGDCPPNGVAPAVVQRLLALAQEGESDARLDGDLLTVAAPRAVHDRIADLLRHLEAALSPTVVVDLHLLPPESDLDGFGAHLDAAACDRLLARVEPVRSHRARGRCDVPIRIEAGELSSFTRDYDVEVAQAAGIADPKCALLFEGLHAAVVVSPDPAGALQVVAGYREVASTGDAVVQDLSRAGLGRLQLPATECQLALASGVVEDGGGLLLGGAFRDRGSVLVRFSRVGGTAVAPGADRLPEIVPLGRLATAPLTLAHPLDLRPPSGDRGAGGFGWDEPAPDLGPRLGWVLGSADDGGSRWELAANAVVLPASQPDVEALRLRLQQLAAAEMHTLRYAMGTVSLAAARELERGTVGAGDLLDDLEYRGRIATRAGDDLRIAQVAERAYLRDLDVEIAKERAMANPIVGTASAGVALDARLAAGSGDGIRVRGRFEWAGPARIATLDSGIDELATIDQVASPGCRGDVDAVLAPGRWEVVQLDPIPGGDLAAVLLLRVD